MKFSALAFAGLVVAAGVEGFSAVRRSDHGVRQATHLKIATDAKKIADAAALTAEADAIVESVAEVDRLSALSRAADEARGLAMDSIAAAKSGHLGIPLGCAEIGAALYGSQMKYNPDDPVWINRDRFILSNGHGSMFIYAWLNLAGFDLPMDELKRFRQHNSQTPGHPEFPTSEHDTPGIECTTGPLGTGVSNAVGFAASEKMAAARYNTKDHEIFDHHIFVLAGDGCFQEGVSAEAAAFAAHENLDNLVVLYDANGITQEKLVGYTQSEDIIARYEAYGWETWEIDGHDLSAVEDALSAARASDNGKPKFIKCNVVAGKGMEETQGTTRAHGAAGAPYVDGARASIGLPSEEKWYVSRGTRDFFAGVRESNRANYDEWQATYAAWKGANKDLARELEDAIADRTMSPEDMIAVIPEMGADDEATRMSGNRAIQEIARLVPTYLTGSADLHASVCNYIDGGGAFGSGFDKTYAGRNIYFGIREHAMGAILNGIAYHGIFKASGSTFLVFGDYLRPTMRVAALSELGRVSYIFGHDSVGVGEDGPTHQPIETVFCMRLIPNLDVFRPADAEETVAAYVASVTRKGGPTAIVLSRQDVTQHSDMPAMERREGALKGAYVAKEETSELDLIIIATGSEVQHALKAAENMPGARVVSMPCMEVFERQSDEYREAVLPRSCSRRIAMEAGVSAPWYKYVSKVVGIDRFGFCAPGEIVMGEMGMTAENLVAEIANMA